MISGEFRLQYEVTKEKKVYLETYDITVPAPEKTYSPYIAKIHEILPAPGQFTNIIPLYRHDNHDYMGWTVNSLVGKEKGSLISLGGFGGYIIFSFDHTILNVPKRRDLLILGNAFYANANPKPDAPPGGSSEPGVIWVAYDANHNGQPDDEEWFEIAGSEHNNPKTIHDYEITYYRPLTEEIDPDYDSYKTHETIKKYIPWKDNQGNSGFIPKNKFHNQSYFPGWIDADHLTFRGTRLPDNAIEESGKGTYWVQYCFAYGYVDNLPNNEIDAAIDFDWAVDKNGKPVHLPGVDFVKVVCGMHQDCGWLGETSTELMGAVDLHLVGRNLPTR